MDPKISQDPYRLLVVQVANKMNELGCKPPTLEVPVLHPCVTAYSHPKSFHLRIDPQAATVTCPSGELTKLVAPSHWEAVAFMVAVESLRQGKQFPRLKIATGQGDSKFNWGHAERVAMTMDGYCEERMARTDHAA